MCAFRSIRLLALLPTALFLSACANIQALNSLAPDSGYQLAQNIVYEPKTGLRLDVYVPNGAMHAPVVVFYYGGRWQQGDKSEYRFIGASLARQGFVTVIPNYREYPQVRFPTFLDDSARAVAWVHSQISSYGGSPGKIVVMGFSSGAYNAAMLALNPAYMKQADGQRSWIKGMVGVAGPYDFTPITAPDLRAIFGPPEQFPQTQPVYWADGSNPPLLLIASRSDHVVDVQNTLTLFQRVSHANGPVEKVLYDGIDHEHMLADLSTTYSGQTDMLSNITTFIKRVTANTQPNG